jgi:ADP-L-glycero-D-manno-heptose 6-epimerase
MYVVTGGAGFIGSNIIHALNKIGISEIIIVDDLTNGKKIHNLADLIIADYVDSEDFIAQISQGKCKRYFKTFFHLGADSSTMEWNGKYLMKNNYEYSKKLLEFSQDNSIQFIYASSASVYGRGINGFSENIENEKPMNAYAYSKFLFDCYVRKNFDGFRSQVVGLRYFNVYGPREAHKGAMASTIYHFNNQVKENKKVRLFKGTDGIYNGEQKRDFVYVKDCAMVNLWMNENPNIYGIFNVGTGVSRTFNDVAKNVINFNNFGEIEYIDFPDGLIGSYQNYTCADISYLRGVGYDRQFHSIESGIQDYLTWLNNNSDA